LEVSGTRIRPSHGRRSAGKVGVSAETAAAAFELLYRAFFIRLVRRASWRFGLSKEDASEVVQDAFIVALAKLDTNGDPIPWLCRTVDNLAVNWSRKAHRRARLMARWGGPPSSERPLDVEGEES
jgi:DNA-directed RNA polymerase specialized sigma24 family protein